MYSIVYIPVAVGVPGGVSVLELLRLANTSAVDVLKIDVEGGEFGFMAQLTNKGTRMAAPACQIVMELHVGFETYRYALS